ncbi:type II toxin-antitoxin system CcdA family antitoxin [Sphingomonas sp. 2R-10]|uniref:type II toxin-antitoxin system CcdA family antitoxin n=1 Tax=Sphingomonas sp. 2R-10 TaxID=3045148 RepID=UPI000F79091F|nr:type II toxin-antitoxin system CcdA family antitoxin [Sphingomonas sp. 2R-10]MDJ0275777.1 type II toxin-antitoxin system CcdA family antitoxin [Sphingomonas sp. 2R-10]
MTSSTPADVALDVALVAQAQAAGIDVAATCHGALRHAIDETARAGLRQETAAAIVEWNDWVGTPPQPDG